MVTHLWRLALIAAILGAALVAPMAAGAQTAAPGVVFLPAYFVQFRPTSAADMIDHLPGFTFNGGDAVRGLSGAAGNVLIDGRPPASKADSLANILSRLPATDVERIDLVRGGAGGLDMGGFSVVANVIRRTDATVQGNNSFAIVLFNRDPVTFNLGTDYTRRVNGRTLELSFLAFDTLSTTGNADGERVRTGLGGYRAEVEGRALKKGLNLRGAYSTPFAGGDLKLRALFTYGEPRTEELIRYPTGPGDRFTSLDPTTVTEAGLDYERALGSRTTGELVFLQRHEADDSRSTSRTGPDMYRFDTRSTYDESVARLTLTRTLSDVLTFEFGGEAALNRLEADSRYSLNGASQPTPNAQVLVEERRAEGFGTLRWSPRENLAVVAALRFEVSTLDEQGDVDSSASLRYAKPSLSMSWSPTARGQLRLRLEHKVGQLDFNDFAASASFTTGTVDAGNANLRPERRWIAEAVWEQRFWASGALVLTARREAIADVLDRVLVQGFEAVGNIGDGESGTGQIDLTLPLDRLGLPKAQARWTTVWTRSAVTDPLTGRTRRISGEVPVSSQLNFNQDLPRLNASWGFDYSPASSSVIHRIFETRTNETGASLGVFYEQRMAGGFSLHIYAANLLTDRLTRDRLVYAGLRDLSPLAYRERREVRYEPWAYIRLRRTF